MTPGTRTIKYQTSFERFVVTLRADSIESATPGPIYGLTTQSQIFYDEIVAVYRYRMPDWKALTLSLLVFLICGTAGLGFFAGAGSLWGGVAVWLGGLGLIGFFFYRGFVRQKTMVRIVSPVGTIEFPCADERIFAELMSHLKVVNAAPYSHEPGV